MHRLAIVAMLAGCVPSTLVARASDRLGVREKHLYLADRARIDGSDVYVFCREERTRDTGNLLPIGGRTYDAGCVAFVCPTGDDGRRCQ